MAVTPYLYKLVWGGTLAGTDSWSCSVHLHGGLLVPPDPSLYAVPLASLMSATAKCSSLAKLDFVKLNGIVPETGKYASPEFSFTYNDITPQVGMGGLGPPQIACAVTLMTENERGRASKGRFYLPAAFASADMDGFGRMTSTVNNALRDIVKTTLDGINAVASPKVVVFSKIGQIVMPVTRIRVGRTLDTQRRRRAQVPEEPGAEVSLA